jgi:hypothetical protein
MKTLFFSLLTALLVISCCKKDEECMPGNLDTNIIGQWTVTSTGFTLGDVEFKANGDLIDVNNILAGGTVGGITLDQKTYSVQDNANFTIRAGNGTDFLDYFFTVQSYTCDEINLNVTGFGFDAKLTRKH